MTTGSPYDQAIAHFRSGLVDLSFHSALEAMRSMDPQGPAELALLCLAEANQLSSLDQVLMLARDRGLQPVTLCRQVCASMLNAGRRAALDHLAAGMPAGHPLRILAMYYAACCRLVAGETEGALQDFSKFRMQVKDYLHMVPFIPDDAFNVPFRQGTLVLPAGEIADRLILGANSPSASLDFSRDRMATMEGRSLYAVFADGRYVERFVRGFARALDKPGRALHVHVINSNERSDRVLSALDEEVEHLSIGVSRSFDRHYITSTSYSCTRFFVLPHLLKYYKTPVIALDIDIFPLAPLTGLEASLLDAKFDFSCYITGRNEPASVYQASIMAFAPTPNAIEFLENLGRFCLPKLDMPARFNWMLDQAALCSMINWESRRNSGFRYISLNEILKCSFNEAVAPVTSEEEKGDMKSKNNVLDQNFVGEDGLIHYDWHPE